MFLEGLVHRVVFYVLLQIECSWLASSAVVQQFFPLLFVVILTVTDLSSSLKPLYLDSHLLQMLKAAVCIIGPYIR